MEYKGFIYTPTPKTAWDNLSMQEKSEMMKVAVRNDLTDLKTIREKYNEFAEGGRKDDGWTLEDENKYQLWRASLPDNLKNTNDDTYDMRAAFKAGMQPTLEADGLYHLGSRDPETGRILKSPYHPTYLQAINTDARIGYYPVVDDKGQTYTQTWEGNKFVEGGNFSENNLSETNQFGGGGYVPSRAIRQRIANWEGAAMNRDTIDPLSGKMAKKNRSFEEVATGFVNAIPKDIRGQVLGNQELADNLYSYAYNVGPGKFKERVVPALRKYYQGNGSVSEVTDSMWASGDKKLRGLRRRRTEERSGVSRALQGDNTANPVSYTSQTDNNGFVPFQPMLPEVFETPHPVVPYSIADISTESQEVAVSPYDIKVLEGQRRRDNLQHFMNMLNMVYGNDAKDGGSFFLPFGTLNYNNTFEDGGGIHIKPENRGKFTALKERTGHSATWFKEHGTPAQKKMATFELNARHWKHGLGGNLFDDGGDKDNIFKYTNSNGDVRYVYQDNSDAEEVPVRPLNTIFPDPAQWTFTDDAGKFYTPRRTTPTNIAELNPDNRTGFERALDNYIGEAFNTVPKGYHTLPAIGAAAFGLANPAIGEAALTSGFGAHGLSKWMNGEVNGPLDAATTALEITPLGRLTKPIYKGVIQPGMRLFNSPLTGNWTKIGSREYRLSPNSLGANGSPIESRTIASSDLHNFGVADNGTFSFTGFVEDPVQMHLKRAQAKGYDTSGINIYDLSKDTSENTAFIESIAKQYGLTPEQTKSFLLSHLGTHGHAAQLAGTRNIIHDSAGDNMSAIISHEIDHLLHYPDEPIPDGAYYPRLRNVYGDYFTQHNNTEISARGSQLHDYFGHTGNEPITENMLEYARQHYIQDTGLNNDMHDFLWTVKDNKKVADWLTKYATGIAPFGIFGTTMYKQKER